MYPPGNSQFVEWYVETKSHIAVQRRFRRKFNRHKGSKTSLYYKEHTINSENINCWCSVSCNRFIGPFCFAKKKSNGNIFVNMLKHLTIP